MLVSSFKTNQKVSFTSCSHQWLGHRGGTVVTETEMVGQGYLLITSASSHPDTQGESQLSQHVQKFKAFQQRNINNWVQCLFPNY